MSKPRQDIEALRLFSAFGIVWFHSRTAGGDWAYAGLVAFLALSVWLGGRGGAPDAPTLARRARRLLWPWLAWSGAYALLNLAQQLPWLDTTAGWPAALLAGTSIHLWYLPFVFGALAGLDVLKQHLQPGVLALGSAVAALLLLVTLAAWRPVTLQLNYPVLQWADAAVPLLAGVFALHGSALSPWLRRAGVAVLLVAALALWAAGQWMGPPLLLGLAAFFVVVDGRLAGMSGVGPIRLNLTPLSSCTFGIYLVHPLVFNRLLAIGRVPADWLPEAIFGVSLALVLAWRALQRVLPRLAGRRAVSSSTCPGSGGRG